MRGLKGQSVLVGVLALAACGQQEAAKAPLARTDSKVIYGNDDRLDVYQEQDPVLRQLADSTVGLFYNTDITPGTTGKFNLPKSTTLGNEMNFCPSEPFGDQPSSAWCSGSLVGPDLILTAGHCAESLASCMDTSFVFGFAVKQMGVIPQSVDKDEVYHCKEVVKQVLEAEGTDFALIRLDRPVVGHTPLKVRQKHPAKVGDSLVMIGHPSGLPVKIAGGAKIRSLSPNGFFVANTDSYGGNSGSAIFDPATSEVVGVLVRGENDYVWNGNCRVSYHCTDDGCRGEDITDMNKIVELAPEIVGGQSQKP